MITMEMLKEFCSQDETRFELLEPFTQGDYTFATDGRMVVRVPRIDEASTAPRKADAAALFNPDLMGHPVLEFPVGWQDLPELWAECQTCAGKGRAQGMVTCGSCAGSGELECSSCLHSHNCDECGGNGEVKGDPNAFCEDCDGLGKYEVVTKIMGIPGRVFFNDRYLRKIFRLPGAVVTHDPALPMAAAYFTFEGGDGLMMPMREGAHC